MAGWIWTGWTWPGFKMRWAWNAIAPFAMLLALHGHGLAEQDGRLSIPPTELRNPFAELLGERQPMYNQPSLASPYAPPPQAAIPQTIETLTLPPPGMAQPGRSGPSLSSGSKISAKPLPPLASAREMALSTDILPTLQPGTLERTSLAVQRYGAIVSGGGWPDIPNSLNAKASGPAVAVLRLRLMIEGDLDPSEGQSPLWSPALDAAVRRFQARHGLQQTGSVKGATLRAMNVPAAERLRQLNASAQRLSALTFGFGPRYIVVNLPSAEVEAVDNGNVVRRYVGIVGDINHASPTIEAKVAAINLNPSWTLPTSIIKNEIIPKMRKDPGWLARSKIRILNGKGEEIDPRSIDWSGEKAVNYILRQDPGLSNSLGTIRLNMPNKLAVYMHDTPGKKAFGADYRFLSHGCVRVQGVYDLATWLLEGTAGAPTPSGRWENGTLQKMAETGEGVDLRLPKPVPVIWTYLTGWANSDNVVQFRDDIYGYDAVSG